MSRFALAFIVVVYLCVAALYAIKTPDWQVPDEPAHYNYIRQVVEDGRFPVLELGDYDQDYLGRLTGERFPPILPLDAVEYEDWQPPLYYLLATPIYLLFDGALLPLRLVSVVLGAGVVLLAYAVIETVFPGRPFIALGTAAFIAFLPQHVAMMAGVNNDSLTELMIGAALWMVMRWVSEKPRGPPENRWLVGLGMIVGLGLVTKASYLPVALTVGLAVLMVWWCETDRAWGTLFRTLAWVFVPALLIAVPWWLRNVALYGGLDIYGTANHDTVVVGQPRTADWIDTYGLGAWLERWVTFTFQSFWGQFGWMGVLMPTWLYRALALCSGVLGVGLFYWLRGEWDKRRRTVVDTQYGTRNMQILVLIALVISVLLTYIYYNRTFVQHQGRYLFPALIPIALGAALAVDALLRLLRLPERLRPLAFAIPYLAMVVLDVYALWRVILPTLT
jgi:4-amino-4-deoxy-L-arabinose transferase-like glycosyltransferase